MIAAGLDRVLDPRENLLLAVIENLIVVSAQTADDES